MSSNNTTERRRVFALRSKKKRRVFRRLPEVEADSLPLKCGFL
jgi:hypothetical protein